jgi:(p)ppGpp synthase/HD superfamily hydrolase
MKPPSDAGANNGRPSARRNRLADLLAAVTSIRPGAESELIGRAYHVADVAHAGQVRKSGDPYITHPLAVAAILARAGADDQTLCAALLHDAVDAGYSLAALRREFGSDIAGLVAGVTALDARAGDGAERGPANRSETGLSADSRVLLIKLADRLHNMRTAQWLPPATQVSKSRDTLEVLVPLAASLGLDAIKAELEELAAGTLNRHGPDLVSRSSRLLATSAALLPPAARSRWRDEWTGELSTLQTSRERAAFVARTLAGIPRLALIIRRQRRPAAGGG